MSVIKNISSLFFMASLLVVLYFVYILFQPFWTTILIAAAITVTFYSWYEWLLPRVRNNSTLASAIMCLVITLLIIVPIMVFLVNLSTSSVGAYNSIQTWLATGQIQEQISQVSNQLNVFVSGNNIDLNSYIDDGLRWFNGFALDGLGDFVRGTAQFFTDLFLMMLTMFFLFRDGKQLLLKIMKLTPLYDKYDREIFDRFREVSYSAIVTTLIVGTVQGLTLSIALFIVGVPALVLTMAAIFGSFIPFVGTAIVWVPVALFLLAQGKWGAALFLTLWGVLVVGVIDNFMRPYLMKGKTDIHPMILFFAIFGGISLFGFWGIIFGPLIVAIALTLLHMYEVEYDAILYGENSGGKGVIIKNIEDKI